MLLDTLLLVGEPDGGGGGAPTPEPPASEPAPEPASEPEAPASGDEPPADEPAATPAEEGDAPPAAVELTAEDRVALLDLLAESDEYKERIAKDAPPPKAEPPKRERGQLSDPFFNAVTQQANDSYTRIRDASAKLAAGELESADDLLADIAVTGAWQAASERRGQLAVNRAVIERALGAEDGLTEGDALHDQYGDLLSSLETAQQNAYRLRNAAVREYDARKRSDMITRAEIMDATAVGDFYHKTIGLAVEKGKLDGKAEAEQSFGKRATNLADKARTNGHTEAIAKAKQVVMAGKVQSSASEPSKPQSDNSREARLQRLAYGGASEDDRRWKRELDAQLNI